MNDALTYPREFLDEGIEGTAEVRYAFVAGEGFHPRRAQVRCRSSYLRVYLLRLLAGLFKEPLSPQFLKQGPLPVRFHFHFELTDRDNPFYNASVPQETPRVAGNTLYFERKGDKIGSWKLGPFSGPAFIPALAVDPEWFLEKAQEILGQKEKPDPLRRYRQDPLF